MKINDFGALASNNNTTAMVQETPLEIIDPRQFLDFEQNKVQQITLDQLKMTNKENRGDDNTQPHGIYHFALIQQVLDMCNEHGYNAEVYDLFATNNRDKQTPGVSLYPELEKQYGSLDEAFKMADIGQTSVEDQQRLSEFFFGDDED